MIECIHCLLAARKTTHQRIQRAGGMKGWLVASMMQGVLGFYEDVIRLSLILGVIVPSLVAAFIIMGILFHLPRCVRAIAFSLLPEIA